MYYFEVLVGSSKYHSDKPLTYASSAPLKTGSVVLVPLRNDTAQAIVVGAVQKPTFAAKLHERIISDSPLPQPLLDLVTWLPTYYPAPFGQIISLLLPPTTAKGKPRSLDEQATTKAAPKPLPALTKDQNNAVETIKTTSHHSTLLHGDTGTGKTRVYLELAGTQIRDGRSVIVLTPEISLTPQLTQDFEKTFPGKTIILHSELTAATRRDHWHQIISSNEPLIIIGPRSALFAPLKNVGLIVVDEFHESAYKQEQAPHYQTSRVAAKLASLHKAKLVLGSATPPITDYFMFKEKDLPIVRMTTQAARKTTQKDIELRVIDLKERSSFTRSPWLADALIESVAHGLDQGEQAMLFLNRRGTARLVLCQACGWQATCSRCDLPLTYHGDSHQLRCHTCGFSTSPVTSCPTCGAHDLTFRSIGTKSLVREVEKLFPQARIGRFDSDNTNDEKLSKQFDAVRDGSIDILVGTQMLGKGLDLPHLTTLGIVQADTSLTFPDYTAEERTYQLLVQALGRINRGHKPGQAFVQTYYPDSAIIKAVRHGSYTEFYDQQIADRQLYGFPPFRYVLKLTCSRSSAASAQKTSQALAETLRTLPHLEIIGPGPAFTEKIHNKYRWHIIVSAKNRQALVEIIGKLPANWSYDIDPLNLL